jgi:multimeric flavodoxin WrbA
LILGIVGSVRSGNTEIMVKEALKSTGLESKLVTLYNKTIKYCNACGKCAEGKCVIEDDMQEIYNYLEEANGIIIGTPVYFGNVSSILKAFFDRTLYLRRNNFKLKNKVGGAIVVGGSRNGGQEYTLNSIHNWMLIHGMIIVGDGEHFGGCGVSRNKGDILSDEEGLITARNLGKNVGDLVAKLY